MTFTERDAIQFEMEELKEQARRDFEIYLTSRNMRNERYTQLMERLREIDERSIRNKQGMPTVKGVKGNPEAVRAFMKEHQKPLPEPKFQGSLQDLKIDKVRPNQEIIVKSEEPIQEEKVKKNYRDRVGKNIKLEVVDPVVEKYLRFRGTEQQLKDIQSYTQQEIGHKWNNFSELMRKLVEVNPKIKKSERRGHYYYDEN